MSKILSKAKIEEYYNKLYDIPSFIETLNTYEKNEVYQFAEKELNYAIRYIYNTLLRSTYNYPEPYKDKQFEYWTEAGHYSNYKKPKYVIGLLTAIPENKKKTKSKLLTLDCTLTNYQIMRMNSELIGFLFAKKIDSLLLYEFFKNKDISNLIGRVDVIKSNRLFAYFFEQMIIKGFIKNKQYISAIVKSKLFYKENGESFKSGDLYQAKSDYNLWGNPNHSDELDKIISLINDLKH